MKLAAEAADTRKPESYVRKKLFIFSHLNTPSQKAATIACRIWCEYGLYTFMSYILSVRNLYVSSLLTDREGKRNSPSPWK